MKPDSSFIHPSSLPPSSLPKSGRRDLNSRLRPWQGRTLPLSYSRSITNNKIPRLRSGFRQRAQTPAKRLKLLPLDAHNYKLPAFWVDWIIGPLNHVDFRSSRRFELTRNHSICRYSMIQFCTCHCGSFSADTISPSRM